MKPLQSIAHLLFVVVLLTASGGCVHPIQPIELPVGRVSPRRVVLVLDQKLANYEYSYNPWVYPLGTRLQTYAQQVVKQCFQRVDVVSSFEQATAATAPDLILIPHVVNSVYRVPAWGGQEVHLTLVVGWVAIDGASHKTIWLKTITASASEPKHLGSKNHQRRLHQKLFNDLSLKTYRAFQEAPALR